MWATLSRSNSKALHAKQINSFLFNPDVHSGGLSAGPCCPALPPPAPLVGFRRQALPAQGPVSVCWASWAAGARAAGMGPGGRGALVARPLGVVTEGARSHRGAVPALRAGSAGTPGASWPWRLRRLPCEWQRPVGGKRIFALGRAPAFLAEHAGLGTPASRRGRRMRRAAVSGGSSAGRRFAASGSWLKSVRLRVCLTSGLLSHRQPCPAQGQAQGGQPGLGCASSPGEWCRLLGPPSPAGPQCVSSGPDLLSPGTRTP